MSAVITSSIKTTEQPRPWYRYGWPWFIISFPFISICLGGVMLYLAFNANNSLVVDDYYKEGKAYNLIIERDRLASLLGIHAEVAQTSEGVIVELAQKPHDIVPAVLLPDAHAANAAFVLPDALTLRWVHVTQAELDGLITLASIGGARYIAQGATLPDIGKFRLHLEPVLSEQPSDALAGTAGSNWRLISGLTGLSAQQTNNIKAPAFDKVFNRDLLQ